MDFASTEFDSIFEELMTRRHVEQFDPREAEQEIEELYRDIGENGGA